MNIEHLREYCLSKKGTTEAFPFDEDTLVFKVMGKMFCLTSLSEPDSINLKCDPEKAIELREQYPCVQPGFHMNKKMWNTVIIDGSISKKLLQEWIDHSYEQVVAGLTKKLREELSNM
ncbi:MAG TPA: MmcQ/YjbR family DNA-binding protein [Bacteroidia bacterium]|nr:MmcQ/YjbR family DNA-binding protein [Bacteroidia bacterium]